MCCTAVGRASTKPEDGGERLVDAPCLLGAEMTSPLAQTGHVDGAELLELLQGAAGSLRPNVVVADVRMPRLSGLGVLAALQRAGWTVPVLLMTALVDESVQTVARRMGAIGVLRKPFETHDLLIAVAKAGALLERSPSSRPPR